MKEIKRKDIFLEEEAASKTEDIFKFFYLMQGTNNYD